MAETNSACVCSRGLINNTLFGHLSSEPAEKWDKPGWITFLTDHAEIGECGLDLWARGLPHSASRNGQTHPLVTGSAAQRRPFPTPHPARWRHRDRVYPWTGAPCRQITSKRKRKGEGSADAPSAPGLPRQLGACTPTERIEGCYTSGASPRGGGHRE